MNALAIAPLSGMYGRACSAPCGKTRRPKQVRTVRRSGRRPGRAHSNIARPRLVSSAASEPRCPTPPDRGLRPHAPAGRWRDCRRRRRERLGPRRGSSGWRLAGLRRCDIVIAAKLDRLFRSALDALQVVESLNTRGVKLHLLDLGGDIAGNGISKLFPTIAAALARAERERIGQVKADQKARGRYLGGKVPFGFRRGDDGELVPHSAEQEALRVPTKWWMCEFSTGRIARLGTRFAPARHNARPPPLDAAPRPPPPQNESGGSIGNDGRALGSVMKARRAYRRVGPTDRRTGLSR